MTSTMGRKKQKKGTSRHVEPRESFHMPVQMQLALECAAALADVPTTKSAFLRSCLESALRQRGMMPVKQEDLRRLVEVVGLENLQPQAREYLKRIGIVQE